MTKLAHLVWAWPAAAMLLCGQQQPPSVQPGRLPATWVPASESCIEQPDWAVHEYNDDFYILRQSGCIDYEKPFVFLIFGQSRALLLDTGAGKVPRTAAVVESVLAKRAAIRKKPRPEVLVVHTHGHGDHTAGDAELSKLAGFRIVPPRVDAMKVEFGIADWPTGLGSVNLGERVLDVVAIPGHDPVSLALYDRATGILLTGDSLYPGRLYVRDWPEFRRSISRLAAFAEARPVAHILGTHIEQRRAPFQDYPVRTTYQPDEHALEFPLGALLELDRALQAAGEHPRPIVRRDFTVVPRVTQ